MTYKYYFNFKSKPYKKSQNDAFNNEADNESDNENIENDTCLCCNTSTSNNYLFCRNCYNDIKDLRQDFDHNRSERNIQNHYFELRDKIKSIDNIDDFNDNIKLMFALAEELYNIYDNDYLSERVSKDLKNSYKQFQENQTNEKEKKLAEEFNDKDFREKWPREYQCADGHYVRSLSEQNIDNWLYNNGYLHAYEKSVYMPTNPNAVVLSDFYLPKGKIYIEFWGIEDDDKYDKRKNIKTKLYDENHLNRIDLTQQDIKRLDDIMPRLIAKFTNHNED